MDQTDSYLSVLPTASPVAVEAAGVWAADNAEAEREAEAQAEAEAEAEAPSDDEKSGPASNWRGI